jgi:hypothetical protein
MRALVLAVATLAAIFGLIHVFAYRIVPAHVEAVSQSRAQ